jgi:hypothetical protein
MSGKKKVAKKRAKSKTAASKKKLAKKPAPTARSAAKNKKRSAGRAIPRRGAPRGSEQSGDLQGLSQRERADSESVGELLEEGNAFEAGVVAGVQEAEDADEKEVRTREVLEDDVPGEYLDKDL